MDNYFESSLYGEPEPQKQTVVIPELESKNENINSKNQILKSPTKISSHAVVLPVPVPIQRNTFQLESCKLFIGGLHWKTTETSLADYFAQFGEIQDCVLMTDAITSKSRGFAFITYFDPISVSRVLKQDHNLDSKNIDAKRLIANPDDPPMAKIFVGGIPIDVGLDDLKSYFADYGLVLNGVLMIDKLSNRSRGFGFITFDDKKSIDELLLAQARVPLRINGKKIEVKFAAPRNNDINHQPRNHDQAFSDNPLTNPDLPIDIPGKFRADVSENIPGDIPLIDHSNRPIETLDLHSAGPSNIVDYEMSRSRSRGRSRSRSRVTGKTSVKKEKGYHRSQSRESKSRKDTNRKSSKKAKNRSRERQSKSRERSISRSRDRSKKRRSRSRSKNRTGAKKDHKDAKVRKSRRKSSRSSSGSRERTHRHRHRGESKDRRDERRDKDRRSSKDRNDKRKSKRKVKSHRDRSRSKSRSRSPRSRRSIRKGD